MFADGFTPIDDETSTIAPLSFISRSAVRSVRNAPVRFDVDDARPGFRLERRNRRHRMANAGIGERQIDAARSARAIARLEIRPQRRIADIAARR